MPARLSRHRWQTAFNGIPAWLPPEAEDTAPARLYWSGDALMLDEEGACTVVLAREAALELSEPTPARHPPTPEPNAERDAILAQIRHPLPSHELAAHIQAVAPVRVLHHSAHVRAFEAFHRERMERMDEAERHAERVRAILTILLEQDIPLWRRWGFTRAQVEHMTWLALGRGADEQVARVLSAWDTP